MNKKFVVASMAALMAMAGNAQKVKIFDPARKWSSSFDALIKGQSVKRLSAKGDSVTLTPDSLVEVNVRTDDNSAQDVASFIQAEGYEAVAPTGNFVTAQIPSRLIASLASEPGVKYISSPRQYHTFMTNVRPDVGVTKVQEGTGLDTPYDGTGVIVGVIDQGYEYKHPAFKDRVKRWGSNSNTGAMKTTTPTSDPNNKSSHATHVTNIAAGSKVEGSDYYGIATGAEIVPMTSSLSGSAIVQQASAIKKYADEVGKPFVLNMSFGSNLGPHDGTSDVDLAMNQLTGKGAIFVAAMGNSGTSNIHAKGVFTADDEPLYLCLQPTSENTDRFITADVWTNWSYTDDSDVNILPCIYANGKLYRPTDAQLKTMVNQEMFGAEISDVTGRCCAQIAGTIKDIASVLGVTANSCYFVWQISGKAGNGFHAWTDDSDDDYAAEFIKFTKTDSSTGKQISTIAGDDEYLVGEGAASVPDAIAVASYNAASGYTPMITGQRVTSTAGEVGGISYFTSPGPWLGEYDKPTIAAPGGVIISAYSKKISGFDAQTNRNLVQSVKVDGNLFYYGQMSGTSMATPVVTGTIALWLQANPDLTPADVRNILKTTARKDSYTGKNLTWDKQWGYGKIDAYEGLKAAINLRTGINEAVNTAAPVTLQKGEGEWKVLFNNDEQFADVRIVAANGQTIYTDHIASPRHGDEHTVSTTTLAPGVYVFQINTAATQLTRKMVVK